MPIPDSTPAPIKIVQPEDGLPPTPDKPRNPAHLPEPPMTPETQRDDRHQQIWNALPEQDRYRIKELVEAAARSIANSFNAGALEAAILSYSRQIAGTTVEALAELETRQTSPYPLDPEHEYALEATRVPGDDVEKSIAARKARQGPSAEEIREEIESRGRSARSSQGIDTRTIHQNAALAGILKWIRDWKPARSRTS